MSAKTKQMNDEQYAYFLEISVRENPVQTALRLETAGLPEMSMQISPEQAQFMGFICRLIGARRALELGVFTGYSALAVALALPADGELIACDVSKEWTSVGQRYWEQAGVARKIKLRLAPAINTLRELINDGQANTFDFAFIDADKAAYDSYYEACLKLVRQGGLIAIDNVLWSGKLINLAADDTDGLAIHALNKKLYADSRVDLSLIPISDGLTLLRKK